MSLSITGYILGPIRVGGANSPFTLTPDDYVQDASAFDTAYPSDESAPRTEYLIQVLTEGTGTGPSGNVTLADATFAWTRNEGAVQGGVQVPFQRFDYADQDGRFALLGGAPRALLGTLSPSSNTTRLVATKPLLTNLTTFPVRVAVGTTGSGTTFPVTLVSSFGSPGAGTVEMLSTSGELNWNPSDLTAFNGDPVYFQRQSFYFSNESDGDIGALGSTLLLNPLPTTGQKPAIKIGFRSYLTAVERANEAAFSVNPTAGTVEWARDTGRLKFNTTDVATFSGDAVFYDGVFVATFQVARQSIGLAQSTPAGTLAIYAPEGSDLYFRIPSVVQFPTTLFVDTFDATGKSGQVQVRRSDGAVQLSAADRSRYTGQTVQAISPDVQLDRGVVLRLFRSIVNPGATDPTVKDVTAIYAQQGAVLADPIVGQPFVTLPALPLEDQTLTVQVTQGTGSFVGTLNRLDGASPPAGKGYLLDFDNRQLTYAERKVDEVLPLPIGDFAATQLPNVPIETTGLIVELETSPGSNVYQTLTANTDFVVDAGSGVVTYTETSGVVLVEGSAVSVTGATLTVAENLTGVVAGDFLALSSGASKGLYTITAVPTSSTATVTPSFISSDTNVPYEISRGKEVLVDRFFRDIPPVDPNTSVERLVKLAVVQNSPRLSIDPAKASQSRFRFGKTTFSTATNIVTTFTSPSLLPSGTVEVNSTTGDLNFSQVDVTAGGDVYWSRELTLGVDYSIQPGLGFISFNERMLEKEEVFLRYTVLDDSGNEVLVQERGTFLVSKEITQPHPSPTTMLSFNPNGREVAAIPAPSAFRGGRPQTSAQVTFDVTASTVTFLDDDQVTDALPHGAIVAPNETVYVDYYIYEALGGEGSLTVAQPPMATVQVIISSEDDSGNPTTSFTIKGDRRPDFPASTMLRVAGSEVYLLAAPTFDGTLTTIHLDQTAPQFFRDDLTNPSLEVTSGATRRVASGLLPAYYISESAAYDTIARGSKQIKFVGDVSRTYVAGIIICLTDSLTFQEYDRVEGSSYDADSNRTIVTLSTGALRQHSTSALLRTVRAILERPTGAVSTSRIPELTLPFQAYRQVEGHVGELLTRNVDYTLDDSGLFTFSEPLNSNEEIGLFYTGALAIEAGRHTKVSWTFTLVPSIDNGLLNQVLTMDYSTYAPDTFFYRVETMTNYRGELVQQFADDAKANSPSQGPTLENSGGQKLFEKGSPSLYFNERDLDNQDIVARLTLKFYNDFINDLEDWLEDWDGRVVGDHDGRFLFDGAIDNPVRSSFAAATNQIDDLIQIRSKIRPAFQAATYSRFYPTQRSKYGAADDPTSLQTGDSFLDLQEDALRQVSRVQNRFPWASVTEEAPASLSPPTFTVDHAQGDATLSRPAIPNGLKVAITDRDGTYIGGFTDASPATVASTTATSITLSALVAAIVPQGATIRMATTDDTFRKAYTFGIDYGVDLDNGFLTHISSDDVPNPPYTSGNSSPPAGRLLDVLCQVGAVNTAPERFPALDGATTDDDGDRQFPILAFNPQAELLRIERELDLINVSGTLRAITTDSFVGTGTVSGSGAILTNGTSWSSPVPKVGDLVRILSSTEGTSFYHRVTAVGGSTVNVEPSFNVLSGAVDFEITKGTARTGSANGAATTTTNFQDSTVNFTTAGVQPGHTVVIKSGTLTGQRRQVQAVVDTHNLTVDAFTTTDSSITYQVVDSLPTFGGGPSLDGTWITDVSEELRTLEGQDFIDFSDLLVKEASTQTATINSISMGSFDALMVFIAISNGSGILGLSSVTFGGHAMTLQRSDATPTSANLGTYVYTATGVATTTGNLVVTAVNATVNLKVFAVKLSSIKALSFASGLQTTVPANLTASPALRAAEAGDLVLSFGCSRNNANPVYPLQTHNTLIPDFDGSGIVAMLTATRASAGNQVVAGDFRAEGSVNASSRVVTVLVSKNTAFDGISGRIQSEKAALEAFFDTVVPDRGLGDLVGNITGANTITGDFTEIGPGALIYVRHGPNNGVYTVASATDSSATTVESFPEPPQTVTYRAGTTNVPSITTMQSAFGVLQNVDGAIVSTGSLLLQQNCPILVYRSGTPTATLPGTPDSVFTAPSGVLTASGARARPVSSLATRATFINTRSASADATTLGDTLTQDKLYDGRYVWIDDRINLETGILPKKTRAVANRQQALATIVENLTKLLTA